MTDEDTAFSERDWLYRYPPLLSGKLLRRYKRFFAEVELDSGEIVVAHCPNTGPMTGVSAIGSSVLLSRSTNPKRKLAYTWELIQVEDTQLTWVGVNTNLPNRILKSALERQLLPPLAGRYTRVQSEVRYGQDDGSRIDFLLTGPEASQLPIYLEVKNATWALGTLALFPDTVTTRGQKHLRELSAIAGKATPAILYFINRSDCIRFAPGESADPVYGELLRAAIAAGVEVLPCRFEVSPEGVRYIGMAELLSAQPAGK
ncbi:sugar fermentation stimulation protein [Rubidibacter lacunae KORDI 51-2]|uniref:Sugar fermentation stimulation protein homolog n=1 Tax=Rubidibacter lacunae KORDI 51-2 TaxID=582515 RepID=U5DT74_9CHRO|nr:DNA/RNA nuclease SfsA [Rubidibacter lacunae]ERN42885.1 sugar fermentation stimulation protein [Rubidibacter lacunae KORDI 51-2]